VKLFSKYSNLCENIPERPGQTDRWTDDSMWHNRALVASRGKSRRWALSPRRIAACFIQHW